MLLVPSQRKLSAIPALAVLLTAGATLAQEAQRVARVTYVTGSTIYLDAGRDDGLAEGLELTLMRGDEVVAVCRVAEVSSRRAACAIERKPLEPTVGDTASIVIEPTPAPAPARTSSAGRSARSAGLRGRVGVGYLFVSDRAAGTSSFSQPAIDLRLHGEGLGGSGWGLDVDARARRTMRRDRDGAAASSSVTRVYRAAVTRRGADDRWNLTLGRQPSVAVAAVGVFDGAAAELKGRRLDVGLFSGSQPDPSDYGHSSEVREHGVYVTAHGGADARRQWAVSSGLVGSYDRSEVNREFVHFQGRFSGPRLTAFATQEVDYNRAWKSSAGEDDLSITSTFVSLSYRAERRLFLRGGYDNRRNVRLYRDFVTPEIEFDDAFREGVWGGLTARVARRFTFGVDGRSNDGGSAGSSTAYTVTADVNGLARRIDVRARSTSFESERESGWLHSLTTRIVAGRLAQLEIGGGVRREGQLSSSMPAEELAWINAGIDLALGNHWYCIVSADLLRGDREAVDQLYARLTYRF
jgi:hypothetical protein